jgi:predicted metal-dependent peptidase
VSRQKRVERAQMRVLFTVPFFAPGVVKLPCVFADQVNGHPVKTACTDGLKIIWNTAFFDSLTDAQLVTVLCHEVAHNMLGHLWRAPSQTDWDVWNQATDHAVNLMLKEFSELTMSKRLADPFPFPDPQDSYLADPKFKGMPEESIYNLLKNNSNGNGQGNGQGQGSGKGKGQGQGGPSRVPFGEMVQPADPHSQTQAKLKNDWNNTLIQSVEISKGRGDIPGMLERLVGELVNPQVPWTDILRSWLREQCSDDWDFLKPDLTMEQSGFILPSLNSDKIGPMIFATDTSGSIDADMLRQYQSEKQNCLDDMRPSKLVDIYCDTKIQKVAEYSQGEVIGKDAPGGGGTSFVPVFEHIETLPTPPKAVVYLTDLDGEFPAVPPPYPTIWVTWGTDKKAPFGETVRADL